MKYVFHTASQALQMAKEEQLDFATLCLKREMQLTQKDENEIKKILLRRLTVMQNSIEKGLEKERKTMGKMGGGDAFKLKKYLDEHGFKNMLLKEIALKAAMYAIANNENNACMGCIVACPTAGSSGVVPGAFFAAKEQYKWTDEDLLQGFLVAGGIGAIIAENATLAGAEGGCQAEIGSAVAMAAAGLAHMRGADMETCLEAASLSLKNLLGLACDPIGGMVEVPCIKRNAFGTVYAFLGADLAIMGIKSVVPFDEVVETLKNIGNMLPAKIRETAMGGLAITNTAKGICKKLGLKNGEKE